MDLICRAHQVRTVVLLGMKVSMLTFIFNQQVVEDGYEFFAKRQLVTLFSAPNYCGEFDNAGAMMSVDETLLCSFQVCMMNAAGRSPFAHSRYLYVDTETCREES